MLVTIGLAAGLPVVLLAARSLAGILYEVRPTDVLTLLSVVAIVVGVSIAASWIPARRASRLEPVCALRYE